MFFFIFKNGKLIIFLFNVLILKDYLKIWNFFIFVNAYVNCTTVTINLLYFKYYLIDFYKLRQF